MWQWMRPSCSFSWAWGYSWGRTVKVNGLMLSSGWSTDWSSCLICLFSLCAWCAVHDMLCMMVYHLCEEACLLPCSAYFYLILSISFYVVIAHDCTAMATVFYWDRGVIGAMKTTRSFSCVWSNAGSESIFEILGEGFFWQWQCWVLVHLTGVKKQEGTLILAIWTFMGIGMLFSMHLSLPLLTMREQFATWAECFVLTN